MERIASSILSVLKTATLPKKSSPDVVYGHRRQTDAADANAVVFIVSGGYVSNYTPPLQFAERFHSKNCLARDLWYLAKRNI